MSWWRRLVGDTARAATDVTTCSAALARVLDHPATKLRRVERRRLDAYDSDEEELRAESAREARIARAVDVEGVTADIELLARARHVDAVPVLAALWQGCPSAPVAIVAGRALLVLATPEAHDALQARLGDADPFAFRLAVQSLRQDTRVGPATYDRLADRANDGDRTAASVLSQIFYDLEDEGTSIRGLAWPALAARLRRGPCEEAACALLEAMPREDVVRLLAQHPLLGSAPRTDLSLLHPERADDDPWDRLRTLGPLDGELRAFALQLAIKALAPVARAADRITERLRALDWPLRQTARRSAVAVSPITAPPDTMGVLDAEIREIERIAGCRVPVTLEAFWRVVGTIDWSPEPDEAVPPWAVDVGLETIDPLCVYGLDAALECMKEWSERRASAKHPELVLPPRLWLAPDRFHKMGISGGEPYEIVLDSCLDPKVENAPEDLCLVPYLENALRWGGMPGIARRKRLSDRTRAALETLTADLELH